MLKLTRLSASSLALLIALIAGSAHGQDATYDIETDNPVVAAELDEMEEEMDEFFDEQKDMSISPDGYVPNPDLDTREEDALLDRANNEMTEFNDIDDDDLAETDNDSVTDADPRLEKPGQIEADFPITCPLGTEAQADGTCMAGPDWTFED